MYNEAAGIEAAVAKLRSCVESLPQACEVLLIDDGSTDPTLRLALKAIVGDRRFRILRHRVNFGRGRALRTGFAEAHGSIIVTTEGDLSWGEDAIGRLIDALDANPALDAVFASPHLPGGGYRNVPRLRVFLSSLGNRILRFFYAGRLSMTTGMTRAYRAGAIQPHTFSEDGKEIHLEIGHRLLTLGYRVGEVPAVLSWPEESGRGSRTNWNKIARLISTHLAFGIFRGISKIIGPAIAFLTVAIIGFGSWAVWNFLFQAPSIYLATLTGVLVILWVTLILGYFLLYHLLSVTREVWRTQCLLGRLRRGLEGPASEGHSPERTYYDEVEVSAAPAATPSGFSQAGALLAK